MYLHFNFLSNSYVRKPFMYFGQTDAIKVCVTETILE